MFVEPQPWLYSDTVEAASTSPKFIKIGLTLECASAIHVRHLIHFAAKFVPEKPTFDVCIHDDQKKSFGFDRLLRQKRIQEPDGTCENPRGPISKSDF